MGCLDDADVLALTEGWTNGDARRRAEQHLETCADCLELVAHARLANSSTEPRTRASPLTTSIDEGDRYLLGPELARGGMGRVLVAHDRRLDREVAIKLLLHDATAGRFDREVTLTSRLEHPSIVPVHDAGVLDDGTPFYAMRMVAGETLEAVVDKAPTLAARLALVPNVLAVADAVAYAHSRGVIHRDLKPRNIVIGEFGETVLLDWGLAKELSTGETLRTDAATADSSSTDADATVEGVAVGTPGYMAPEQLAGLDVDRQADVYGLGATLYHVLAGRPPRRDSTPPLDTVVAGVPRELATIVARAMAARPDDRYPSARELAAELRRFQAGSLVLAHHYSIGQRLARWIGRNRTAVVVGAAALVVIAALAITSLIRIDRERRDAQDARATAETQRDAAQGLVGFVLDDLHDRLERFGRLDLLARTGAEIITYYRKIGGTSPVALKQRAAADQAYGDAQLSAGDAAGALAAYQEALDTLEHLAPSAERDHTMCNTRLVLGDAERAAGRVEAATATYRACSEQARLGLTAAPGDADWRSCAVGSSVRLAEAVGHADVAAARRLAEDAIALAAPLLAGPGPGDVRAHTAVVRAAVDVAVWAMETYDWAAAEPAARRALAAAQALATQRPDDIMADVKLTAAWNTIGRVREHAGDLAGADDAFHASYKTASTLVAREPRNVQHRRAVLVALLSLGRIAQARGDDATARTQYEASREVAADLVATAPADVEQIEGLAASEVALADLVRTHDRASARAAYQRGIDVFTRAQALAPSEVRLQTELGVTFGKLAELQQMAGDLPAARDAIDRGLVIARAIQAATPSSEAQLTIAQMLLFKAGVDPPNARAALAEAVALVEPQRAHAAGDAYLTAFLAELDRDAQRAGLVPRPRSPK